MKTKFLLSFLLTFFFTIINVLATQEQADGVAQRMASLLRNEGWYVRPHYMRGSLDIDDSYTYTSTFYAGRQYVLVAGGCNSATDVDLTVYNGFGDPIATDDDHDKSAVVFFTPTVSGTFYIEVNMYDAISDGSHWALVYGWL